VNTGAKVTAGCIGAIVLVLVLVAIGLASSWFGLVVNKVSPANVQEQWQFAYEGKNNMVSAAQQACAAQKAVEAETDPQAKTQRRDQLNAIVLNYSRIEANYNAGVQNAFKAKYIKPNDVPTTAPTLQEEEAAVCQ
jgi:uncharacterized iron-regulated membrane protein